MQPVSTLSRMNMPRSSEALNFCAHKGIETGTSVAIRMVPCFESVSQELELDYEVGRSRVSADFHKRFRLNRFSRMPACENPTVKEFEFPHNFKRFAA